MVIDDSVVVRGLLTRALEHDPQIRVMVSVGDTRMAVDSLKRRDVDVAVLDIETPAIDGLAAVPLLLEVKPGLPIIMASTLSRSSAETGLRGFALGAKDHVARPTAASQLTASFQQELIAKVTALAGRRVARPAASPPPTPAARLPRGATVTLRGPCTEVPEVLAIGSSTGGPQALFKVVGQLSKDVRQPILITQHMPATFTTILAEHLARASGRGSAEAKDGEPLEAGRIYVAPGDFHMVVEGQAPGRRTLRLLKTPPENFCRPAVDPMLRSLADSFGRRVLVAILTGMGYDGQRGAERVVGVGGTVIAQDEASSVVWGMPGAVALAGLCSAVLPLGEIGPYLQRAALRSAA